MNHSLDDYIQAHYGAWSLDELEYMAADLKINIGEIFKKFSTRGILRYHDPFKVKINKDYILKYHETLTADEIGKEFYLPLTRIHKLCKQLNVRPVHGIQKYSDNVKKYIIGNSDTKTIEDFAKHFGVTTQRIYQILRKTDATPLGSISYNVKKSKTYILENYQTKTKKEIAEHLSLSLHHVMDLFTQLSIPKDLSGPPPPPLRKIKYANYAAKEKTIMDFLKENPELKTFGEVSREFDISSTSLARIYKKLHLKHSTDLDKRIKSYTDFVRRHAKKYTKKEIAEKLKLSRVSVEKYAKKAGVTCITPAQKKFLSFKKYLYKNPRQSTAKVAKALGLCTETVMVIRRKIKKEVEARTEKTKALIALKKNTPSGNMSRIVREIKKSEKHKTIEDLIKKGSNLKFNFSLDSGLLFSEKKKK